MAALLLRMHPAMDESRSSLLDNGNLNLTNPLSPCVLACVGGKGTSRHLYLRDLRNSEGNVTFINWADELPVHYRGGVGKSEKRRVGGGNLRFGLGDQIGTVLWY
jgi:hypothetical protein